MTALLAIISHVQPNIKMHDTLSKTISEKYGEKLAKIEAGEDGYEDLFTAGCPKFVSPVVPSYAGGVGTTTNLTAAAYRRQVQQTVTELTNLSHLPKLRSYLKLYTSIDTAKLATFNGCDEPEIRSRLLAFKQKQAQPTAEGSTWSTGPEAATGQATDVDFHVEGNMVVVNSEKKERVFANYFFREMGNCDDVRREVEAVPSEI